MVTGIATILAVGPVAGFLRLWMGTWIVAWAVAFPTILIVAPLIRQLLARIVREA